MNSRLLVVPVAAVIVLGTVSLGGGTCVGPSVSPLGRSFAACPQTTATLHVDAQGTGPLHYQWRRYPRFGSGIVSIPNSDSPTLTIDFPFLSDAGKYDCIIFNLCGSTTTPIYRLAILAADRGSSGGIQGSDGVVNNDDFIVFINQFFESDIRADIGSAGGFALPDGQFDNNDFIAFINLFFSFPNCP
jgi:hypothetical protein